VRHLAAELGEEFTIREQDPETPATGEPGKDEKAAGKLPGTINDLRALAQQCAGFLLGHNAEPDAVDLLEELEIVDEITQLVDDNTYGRVCQYMIRFVM
jgi:26S proteasome regulatory subunit N1